MDSFNEFGLTLVCSTELFCENYGNMKGLCLRMYPV